MKKQTKAWVKVIDKGAAYRDIGSELFQTYINDTEKYQFFKAVKRQIGKSEAALEAGCGWALTSFTLANHGYHTVALDVSETVIQGLKQRQKELGGRQADYLQLKVGDMFELHRLNMKFDVIFSDGTYEHFLEHSERQSILNSFSEVLNGGGRIAIQVPNRGNPFYKLIVRKNIPAIHVFNMKGLEQEITQGGFLILEKGYSFVNAGFRQWLRSPWMILPVVWMNRVFGHLPVSLRKLFCAHFYVVAQKV